MHAVQILIKYINYNHMYLQNRLCRKEEKMRRTNIWIMVMAVLLCLSVMSLVLIGCTDTGGNAGPTAISITNKQDLTAEWEVGDPDRTVGISFTPDTYTEDDYPVTVSSNNSAVITVSGKTLKAVGVGTATVTATAGELSDTVEITVSPTLAGISISNKDALQAVWHTGDADRTVEISFTPDGFTLQDVPVTVTSDDPTVISVDGMTLSALKEGTATITASAEGFTDSVELSVRPAIESISITNKTALQEDWSVGDPLTRTIQVEISPSEYYNADNTPVTVTASPEGIVTIDGLTLTAVNQGSVTVTVSAGGFEDSVQFDTVLGNPTISVMQDSVSGYYGNPIALPSATAQTCDGRTLEYTLSLPEDTEGATLTGEFLEATTGGVYEITYTATDTRGTGLIATATVTVNVGRDILDFCTSADRLSYENEYGPDKDQVVTTSDAGYVLGRFMMQPSDLYYAEITFVSSSFGSDHPTQLGMSHWVSGVTNRALISEIDTDSASNHRVKDFDMSGSWNLDATITAPVFQSWGMQPYRGFEYDATNFTYATMRSGDYIYNFIDGQYVNAVSLERYRNQDTVPGFFGVKMNNTRMTNIVFVSGTEAQEKIDALLGQNNQTMLSSFATFVNGNNDQLNTDNRYFTVGSSEKRGLYFDYTKNDATGDQIPWVTPYLYADGDMSFSFEYDPTSYGGSGNHEMFFTLRSWPNSGSDANGSRKDIVRIGGLWTGDNAGNLTLLDASGNSLFTDQNVTFGSGFDASEGIRFTVSRTVGETAVEYTVTAQSLANSEQTVTVSFDWGETDDVLWNQPVQVFWTSRGIAGQFSQIEWSVGSDE